MFVFESVCYEFVMSRCVWNAAVPDINIYLHRQTGTYLFTFNFAVGHSCVHTLLCLWYIVVLVLSLSTGVLQLKAFEAESMCVFECSHTHCATSVDS